MNELAGVDGHCLSFCFVGIASVFVPVDATSITRCDVFYIYMSSIEVLFYCYISNYHSMGLNVTFKSYTQYIV